LGRKVLGRERAELAPVHGPENPDPARKPFVWGTAISAQLLKARAWSNVSVYNFLRPACEMLWEGSRHRVSLQLARLPRALVQVEHGHRSELRPLLPLSFTPADVPVRTVMGEGKVISVLQAGESYADIAPELAKPCRFDLEPIWSMEDPVLETLVRLLLARDDHGIRDDVVPSMVNTAIAVRIARRIAGPDVKLPPPTTLSPICLSRVIDYIDSHLDGPLTLSALAAQASLSPFYFSRSFKRSMGIGLHQFIIRRRIERAKQLVKYSARPLVEIGLLVGFDSQASFSARFHREVGISPGNFRKIFR
jgi:AraC family transcriptional regulator